MKRLSKFPPPFFIRHLVCISTISVNNKSAIKIWGLDGLIWSFFKQFHSLFLQPFISQLFIFYFGDAKMKTVRLVAMATRNAELNAFRAKIYILRACQLPSNPQKCKFPFPPFYKNMAIFCLQKL